MTRDQLLAHYAQLSGSCYCDLPPMGCMANGHIGPSWERLALKAMTKADRDEGHATWCSTRSAGYHCYTCNCPLSGRYRGA